MSKKLKVLYLFAGERKKLIEGWKGGLMPDSHLIGFNHLAEYDVEAEFIENRFLNFIRKRNFNLTNLFIIPWLSNYDVVFSGASLALPLFAKFFLRIKKPKFVWYNTYFTNTLKRNVNSKFKLWLVKKAISSLDAIICPSTAQRNFLIQNGFDASKIYFVPNGIDVDFMNKKKKEVELLKNTPEPFILSVGKDMGRDYKTLLEAVRNLPIKVKVVALPRNFPVNVDLPKNVDILGFVPFPDLIKLYINALVVVIPTKSENHLDASDCSGQYVLLDAMSLGKPIVASMRETLADYFVNDVDGLVVKAEDSKNLEIAITKLISDTILSKQLGKNSEEKAKKFTTKNMASELAKIFKTTISSK